MRYLRTNTATIVTVGPFVDKTDGVTLETGLTITNERISLTVDANDGSAPTLVLDNVTGATSGTSNDLNYIANCDAGLMQLELAAANVNYVGRAFLTITDAANHVPVFHEFTILPANVYDALILGAGTDLLDVSAVQLAGTALTGRDIGASVLLSAGTGTGQLDIASGKLAWNAAWDAEVESEVDDALGGGTGTALTAIPWNAAWDAEVQSEAADALAAYDPPTNAEMEARTIAAADYVVVGDTLAAVTTVGSVTGAVGSVTAEVTANVTKISGDATAADRLEALLDATPNGAVVDDNDPDPTATAFETNLAEGTNDHYNGAFCVFTSGALLGQSRKVSDYDGTSKVLTVASAFTEAPAADDTFIILGRSE